MKYTKPSFEVTKFNLNQAITICAPEDVYNQVTVRCVISGSHVIFYTGCEANYEDLTIVPYNGAEYLVWSRGNGGGSNRPRSQSELQDILEAGSELGILPGNASRNWTNYHAGKITPDVESVRNQSA